MLISSCICTTMEIQYCFSILQARLNEEETARGYFSRHVKDRTVFFLLNICTGTGIVNKIHALILQGVTHFIDIIN